MRARKPYLVALTLAVSGFVAFSCVKSGLKSTPKTEAKAVASPSPEVSPEEEGEDVLAEVLKTNSSQYPSPPTTFRTGHVTPRKLSKKALQQREGGFAVQLPSNAPIATPVFYDGKVFVSGGFHSKEFYAFDAKNGKLAWGISLDDDGPSTAACEDGLCAFNTESCTLFVVSADTGKQVWSLWLGDPLTSAPTIANGKVFTSYPARGHKTPPGITHALAAFDLKTGKILWQKWIDADVMTAPIADGDEIFASTFAGTVYKIKQDSGEITSARRARATSAPTIVAGNVYYSKRAEGDGEEAAEAIASTSKSTGKTKYLRARKKAAYLDHKVQGSTALQAESQALDASNGFGTAPAAAAPNKALMNVGQGRVSSMQSFQGSRVLNKDGWNYNSMGDELLCTNDKDGSKKWSVKLDGDTRTSGGFLAAPPVMAGKKVIVGTLSGEILIVNPETGKKEKSFKVGSPIRYQPIVQDGWIYVGTQNGKLIAIDTKDASLTGWTHWGGDAGRNKT